MSIDTRHPREIRADIRSGPGEGTEVRLHLPLVAGRGEDDDDGGQR